ncbi:hypothetical protein NHU_00411 [Rhodovulum sulfidophilum]|uniref:DUF6950 domain-containing protein n=1 Tax=Rhodovulum sulfidophilum TaxID=35806 RepID=A0A0D6AXT5_RHOSU|nr:hypothetical protein NHU_00411 [Rhodovulum sulfidophilum]
MTRQPLWQRRISPELGTWEGRSVDWGRAYCFGRCQAIARAMTGTDPIPDLPDYALEYEAAKRLVSFGFGSIEAAVDAHLERLPIAMARRCDWVMGDAAGATGQIGHDNNNPHSQLRKSRHTCRHRRANYPRAIPLREGPALIWRWKRPS